MDLEYTFWQMYLLCTNPKVVYRHTMYRKREPPPRDPHTHPPPTLHPPSIPRRSERIDLPMNE
jgi:hypothetical protein